MFFSKKILAIDISDSSIEILQMSQFLGKTKVTFLSRSELGNGVVEKGRVINRKQLALRLKEYSSGCSTNKVAMALPDVITSSHIFHFPKDKELKKDDIWDEAKKVMAIELSDSYWDYSIQDVNGEKIVFFAAALKRDIDEYRTLFEETDFDPKFFDLNSLCALREIETGHEGALVVDIGGRYGVLNVFDNGILQFSNIVDFGGENFTEKLMGKLSVSYEEAEVFKMNIGFNPDKEDGKIFLALQEILQPLIDEMRKVINSYEDKNNNPQRRIKKIILTGGSALMPNICEYIFENFSIRTEIGRPREGDLVSDYLKANKISNGIDTIFFATTLGLAHKYLGIQSQFNMGINLLK